MIKTGLATALAAGLLLTSPRPSAPDPCQLLTAAEIKAALGRAPAPGKLTGPSRDKETNILGSTCTLDVGEQALFLTIIEFANPAAALAWFTEYVKVSEEDLGVKMTPQSGLGERAAWGASPDATWLVLKGKYALNVMFESTTGDGTRHREPLKKLAASAVSKL